MFGNLIVSAVTYFNIQIELRWWVRQSMSSWNVHSLQEHSNTGTGMKCKKKRGTWKNTYSCMTYIIWLRRTKVHRLQTFYSLASSMTHPWTLLSTYWSSSSSSVQSEVFTWFCFYTFIISSSLVTMFAYVIAYA